MRRSILYPIPCLIVLITAGEIKITAQSLPLYQPDRTEVLKAYKNASRLDSLARNAVIRGNIRAHWQPDGKSFWYRNTLADSSREYNA